MDEGYRKAMKLDRDQFAVDFHPNDYGIVDAIRQVLLSGLQKFEAGQEHPFLQSRAEHRGVTAGLYKLNVSSRYQGFEESMSC